MKFSLADPGPGPQIQSYGPDYVRVDGKSYRSSLILTPEQVLPDWAPRQVSDLCAAHLQTLLDLAPQIILLGTGPEQRFPEPDLYNGVLQQGIGLEIMDTGAACRTYQVLRSEDRRVVAGFLLG